MAAYVASKWGLEGYARAVQMEWEGTGVRASVVRPGPTVTGMGLDWDPEVTGQVLSEWTRWGLARHPHFMQPASVAAAVVAAVSAERGAHFSVLEVQPEGPIEQEGTMTEGVATVAEGLAEPPLVSGGEGEEHGHLEELRHDPIALMRRVRAECGDVGRFRLAGRDVVLLTGAEANELYFRAPEEQLDQAEAYPFMTPIFGEGVVFDAPPERRREMLHNQALRDKFMRGHAATIAAEVDADGGRAGTTRARSTCSSGSPSSPSTPRPPASSVASSASELDGRFARLYHDLEQGTDAIAYVDPYAPIESFRRRDEARAGLVRLVQEIMERRAAADPGEADRRRARPAGRAHVDHGGGRQPALRRRHGDRDVHLDDVRRTPHHLGHRGLDPHRAAAPPRGVGARSTTSSTGWPRRGRR